MINFKSKNKCTKLFKIDHTRKEKIQGASPKQR